MYLPDLLSVVTSILLLFYFLDLQKFNFNLCHWIQFSRLFFPMYNFSNNSSVPFCSAMFHSSTVFWTFTSFRFLSLFSSRYWCLLAYISSLFFNYIFSILLSLVPPFLPSAYLAPKCNHLLYINSHGLISIRFCLTPLKGELHSTLFSPFHLWVIVF